VRADSGFFDDKLLSFLEERGLPYIVVARLTRWIKDEATNVRDWKDLDATYSVAEFNKHKLRKPDGSVPRSTSCFSSPGGKRSRLASPGGRFSSRSRQPP